MRWSFQFGRTQLRHIRIVGYQNTATGKMTVTGIDIRGELVVPTDRFWDAVCRQFGIQRDRVGHADWATLWQSIVARRPHATVDYWISRDTFGDGRLISVSPAATDRLRSARTAPRRLGPTALLPPRRPSSIHLPLDPPDDVDGAYPAPSAEDRWRRPGNGDHDRWPLLG